MADLDAVYAKTPSGVEEMRVRALALSRVQRTLLILIDGRSPLSTFARVVGAGGDGLAEAARALLNHSLIALAGGSTATPRPATVGSAQQPVDVASVQPTGVSLRDTLTRLAEETFGAKAGPVVNKLASAGGSTAELLAAAEAAAKLAKLTIDEHQSAAFLAEARRILS